MKMLSGLDMTTSRSAMPTMRLFGMVDRWQFLTNRMLKWESHLKQCWIRWRNAELPTGFEPPIERVCSSMHDAMDGSPANIGIGCDKWSSTYGLGTCQTNSQRAPVRTWRSESTPKIALFGRKIKSADQTWPSHEWCAGICTIKVSSRWKRCWILTKDIMTNAKAMDDAEIEAELRKRESPDENASCRRSKIRNPCERTKKWSRSKMSRRIWLIASLNQRKMRSKSESRPISKRLKILLVLNPSAAATKKVRQSSSSNLQKGTSKARSLLVTCLSTKDGQLLLWCSRGRSTRDWEVVYFRRAALLRIEHWSQLDIAKKRQSVSMQA